MNLKGCFLHSTTNVRTPRDLLEKLRNEFGNLYDPCPINGKGGLDIDWQSPAFVNPPYGRQTAPWVGKAVLQQHRGVTVVMLLPARTDLGWFHDFVLPFANEIRFIQGRLRFEGYKSGAPFPSMLVIFRGKTE